MPVQASAAESTTLTTARQSSHLLQLLRVVIRGSGRDLRRYFARGGDPNARVYQALEKNSFFVSCEEYTGPGTMIAASLLAMCCFRRWREQIGLIIDAGADPDSDAGTSVSPMCTAASHGHAATMAFLQSKGASINCEGTTPLMTASARGQLEAVEWLVENGANAAAAAFVPGASGQRALNSPMLSAAMHSHIDVMRYLHARGAPFIVEAQGQMTTALHSAAACGLTECVRFILACGFEIQTQMPFDLTALHIAAQADQREVIQLLLDSGADIEALDDVDCTPLMNAVIRDQAEAVTVLVARGAVIHDGEAAVTGVMHGRSVALKALMTSPEWLAMSGTERIRAEWRLLQYVDDTPTMKALRSLVLNKVMPVSNKDRDGNNALHYAALVGKAVPLICALITEGVDPTLINDASQTPADVAHEKAHTLQSTLLNRAADDKRKRDLLQQQQQTDD